MQKQKHSLIHNKTNACNLNSSSEGVAAMMIGELVKQYIGIALTKLQHSSAGYRLD